MSIFLAVLLLAPAENGTFRYEPVAAQSALPERYRLEAKQFAYTKELKYELKAANIDVYRITFPSPVNSETPANNTVHAEYYRPKGSGPFPAIVVLDITGGDQSLSRSIATYMAQHGVASLFVQMAYYGPRRPPGSKLRLMSTNLPHTIEAVRQTVFDVRVAANWLATRPEVDPDRVGVMGTSLGSFIATLCGETEPRFRRVAILLGGGGLVDAFYMHPQAKPYRVAYELLGGNKEKVKEIIAPVDPITLGANLKHRDVLMLCASRDEIVPPSAARALWAALGEPKILWYDTTHFGAALFIPQMLPEVLDHFAKP